MELQITFTAFVLGAVILFCATVYKAGRQRGIPAELAEVYAALILTGVATAIGLLAVVIKIAASIITLIIR